MVQIIKMLSHNGTNNLQKCNCTILTYNNNNDQDSFDKWAKGNGIALGCLNNLPHLLKDSNPPFSTKQR